jgi:arylsulfatase A-like enzyme/Flp pilus assembly protein TadD
VAGAGFVRAVRAASLLFVALAAGCKHETPPQRRNVLLVSLDTTRADALAPYGAPDPRTPTLAALGRKGVVFETAISPVPLTLPSHATMLTGLDPPRHSVRDNSIYSLPGEATTLAEVLHDAGWRTIAAVGSVILLPRFGLDQGFEQYDVGDMRVTAGPEHERRADAVVDALLKLLPGREPFFAFLHLYDPHRPYVAEAELEQRFGDPYFAEIHVADRALGRVIDALRADGRLDRTIVVVTADHGEGRGEHGESTHGLLVHDATQHVPLIVCAPGLEPRRVSGLMARTCDVMPTILELAGVPLPAVHDGFDGRSLAPALRGEEMEDADAYVESLGPLGYDYAPLYGVRTLQWKLAVGARAHLWDLSEDPLELHDVAPDHPDIVAALTRRALHLRDERGAALTRKEQLLTGDELRVFGGLGYAAGDADATLNEASGRPDPYDDVAGVETTMTATLAAEEGHPAEAIAELEPLVRRYPGISHARQLLGTLYGKRGEHQKALDELLAAAKLRPRSPDLRMEVALAAWLSQRPEIAREHLEVATKLPGCPARAFLMLAEALENAGERPAARAMLLQLLERKDLEDADRAAAEGALKDLGQ